MSRANLIAELAADLNDSEAGYVHTTWTAEQLGAYITEALGLLFNVRPDSFIETKVLKVEPCSTIQSWDCCDKIHRIIGQCTETGRLIKPLRERGLETTLQWSGKPCVKRTSMDRLTSYSIDKVSDTVYLYPEVWGKDPVYILAECSVIPDDNTPVRPDDVAAVKQWALYRARMVDGDMSPSALSAAQVHYKVWTDLTGLEATTTVIHKRASS